MGSGISSNTAGFIGSAVAIVGFGSNFVPVKHVETGDGVFFQWIMCSGIWFVGLMINLFRYSPIFYPLSMLGGFLWATGNIMVVPILKTIGLGPGLLIWASVNMIAGWASGHFGWFGLNKDVLTRPTLNYIGFALAFMRLVIFVWVKPDPVGLKQKKLGSSTSASSSNDNNPLLNDDQHAVNVSQEGSHEAIDQPSSTDASWVDNLSTLQKRIVGCVLSTISGVLYGFNFIPCLWIQDNVKGASQEGLDYVFAHFCGIYATSTAYFLIYSAYKQNKPQYSQNLVLPSLVCGAMWAVAQAGWFVANTNLSESVAFPIVTTGPSILAGLWSVFYFREIRGLKNYILLVIAFTVATAGVVCTAFSKV
ncbi:transmembrane protein 144 [Strongylocentrotus purpuratus]|uniref:Transmembrane protein 144 n=1 Tax=Strongylocentrotus purpuratus TaxID=7668 RepID=A0A7M7NGL7_STRPU|nr:transmembrane protein 144 [Strongylocentrotus purpuratus]